MRSKIGYADPHVLLQIFNLFFHDGLLLLFIYVFPFVLGYGGLVCRFLWSRKREVDFMGLVFGRYLLD